MHAVPDSRRAWDAVVVGSGPGGLAAGIELARSGASVLLIEGAETVGGGMRTAELTLPGFRHDVCSAAHPMGVLSPFFRQLPLEDHGLRWAAGPASYAQPLDEGAVIAWADLQRTVEELGADGRAWQRLVGPFLPHAHALLEDAMGPLGLPRRPFLLANFGLRALPPATLLARALFRTERARALFAGCAAHSILPLEAPLTAALGVMFALTGHVAPWPVAVGGSQAVADALRSHFEQLGGVVQVGRWVKELGDLPPARVVLFDTSPAALLSIAGDALPPRYRRALSRYRYGPGVFKLDWALDGPIPWADPRVAQASTVHVGGTLEEVAASERAMFAGEHPEQPFLIVVQQSHFDPSRAPQGKHTGYAYCHVPAGSTVDMTERIEAQLERFAPGFRDQILARHVMPPAWLEQHNPNNVGGAVTGGEAAWDQLFFRPTLRLDPYATPNPRLFLCSASTPPGGGVHGMTGYHAARSASRRMARLDPVVW